MNCMLFKQIFALNLLLLFSGNIGFRLWSRFFHSNQKKSSLMMNRCEKCHKDRPSAWMSTSSIDAPEEVFHRCDIEGEKFDIPLKIVSFNILAPIYKRLKDIPKSAINDSRSSDIFLLPKVSKQAGALPPRVYEAQYEDLYLERNEKICDQLLSTDADIICLQEFWTGSPSLIQLYLNKLCHNGKYSMKLLERTSHWRSRKDGLAVFIKNDNIQIEDVREILFHDVGDRVALMMLLSILPNKIKQHLPASVKVKQREHFILPHRFICVNMHLIAPHNEYTAKIRIREVAKVLGYIRDKELMDSAAMKNDVSPSSPVCSRTYADYKLPIIISGDMNCGPGGKAYSFVKSQNYKSACENCILHSTYTPSISNNITILSPASSSAAAAVSNGGKNQQNYDEMISSSSSSSSNTPSPTSGPGWVSHHTHLDTNVFVDHIFYLNPSEQTSLLTPPDWTNVVYQELMERIRIKFQNKTLREVFDYFDHDKTNTIDRKGFMIAIEQLGFSGEDSAALTKEEVEVLLKATDVNNDGYINYKELYDRFWIANEELKRRNEIQQQQQQNRFDNSTILSVPPQVECDDFDQPVLEPREVSSFARTKFLAINGSQDNATIADLLQPYQHQLKKLAEAVPLGDLQVANLTITPKILEHGEWPSDYQLSDHGMLECVFNAEVRI